MDLAPASPAAPGSENPAPVQRDGSITSVSSLTALPPDTQKFLKFAGKVLFVLKNRLVMVNLYWQGGWLLITQGNKFSFHVDTKKNQNGYIWLAFENLLNLNMYMCIFFDKKLVSLCFSVVNNRQLHVYVCFQRPTEQFWTRFCVSPPPPCLTDRSPCWSTTPVSWTLMWSGGTSDRN